MQRCTGIRTTPNMTETSEVVPAQHQTRNSSRLDELPETLTAADVIAYLHGILGRNAVYELLHTQGIRNRRHGQKFLIPKAALREFVECCAEDSIAGTPR